MWKPLVPSYQLVPNLTVLNIKVKSKPAPNLKPFFYFPKLKTSENLSEFNLAKMVRGIRSRSRFKFSEFKHKHMSADESLA